MATSQQSPPGKDHWSSDAYQNAASFVPILANKVVKLLDPQPGDHILDLGCGDGPLTSDIAKVIHPGGGQIVGLDASQGMISAAETKFSSSNCKFFVQDCTAFTPEAKQRYLTGKFDKVFSNAALHWILKRPETRDGVLRAASDALKKGGTFAFEMGGHGNVADAHTALIAALVAQNVTIEVAREISPWFFPSSDWIRAKLESIGFDVAFCELEYRPTKLTPNDESGKGGLEGWVRLMGANFLEVLEGEDQRDCAVKAVCDILETVVTRVEDGSQWLGYVRLRVKATKSK